MRMRDMIIKMNYGGVIAKYRVFGSMTELGADSEWFEIIECCENVLERRSKVEGGLFLFESMVSLEFLN
jgi:hypothetical protein